MSRVLLFPLPPFCVSAPYFFNMRVLEGFSGFQVFWGFQKQRERMDTMNKEQDDSKIENGGVFHFVSPFQGD